MQLSQSSAKWVFQALKLVFLKNYPPSSSSFITKIVYEPREHLHALILEYNFFLLGDKMTDDCIGERVEKLVAALLEGGVLLLENVSFYKEDEKNDLDFAKKLASLADLYVNDAFETAHRAHTSTKGVAKFLKPAVADFLMQKELDYLVGAVANPRRPFAALVGGSRVSSKIRVIESLLEKRRRSRASPTRK